RWCRVCRSFHPWSKVPGPPRRNVDRSPRIRAATPCPQPRRPRRKILMRICFIGLGHLNSAILAGLLAGGYDRENITATTQSQTSARQRSTEFGIEVVSTQAQLAAIDRALGGARLVVRGVQPPHIADAAGSFADALRKHTTVVSVAAGITLANLAAALPEKQPVIRSMPNVALTVGKGLVAVA